MNFKMPKYENINVSKGVGGYYIWATGDSSAEALIGLGDTLADAIAEAKGSVAKIVLDLRLLQDFDEQRGDTDE